MKYLKNGCIYLPVQYYLEFFSNSKCCTC